VLHTIAIRGYRSLREVVVPLSALTVVSGANGTGKSSVYRALKLLSDCGRGEVIGALAREGGLESVLWAGPEQLGGARRTGAAHGTTRTRPGSLELGFSSADFGYLIDLGLPQDAGLDSAFARDPEIKREAVFAGPRLRPSATLVRRTRDYAEVAAESGRGFDELTRALPSHRSVLAEYAHPGALPELAAVRDRLRGWRFYDGFRVDAAAPARQPRVARAPRRSPTTGATWRRQSRRSSKPGSTTCLAPSPTPSTAPRSPSPSTTACSIFSSTSAACCARCGQPNYPTAHCVSCFGAPRY
jgi:predicted ATPase